jgi:hypothetical protein
VTAPASRLACLGRQTPRPGPLSPPSGRSLDQRVSRLRGDELPRLTGRWWAIRRSGTSTRPAREPGDGRRDNRPLTLSAASAAAFIPAPSAARIFAPLSLPRDKRARGRLAVGEGSGATAWCANASKARITPRAAAPSRKSASRSSRGVETTALFWGPVPSDTAAPAGWGDIGSIGSAETQTG